MNRSDMDALLDDGIKTALRLLEKNGEFFPFAVAMSEQLEIRHVHALMTEDRPPSTAVIDSLLAALREQAVQKELIAAAIVSDVRLTDTKSARKFDAIQVEIEGIDSDPVRCLLPYEIASGEVRQGELTADRGDRRVFR